MTTENATRETTQPTRMDMLEMKMELSNQRVEFLESLIASGALGGITTVKPNRQRAGPVHKAKRVTDTKTGVTYKSLGECGNAVATEFGLEPGNWVWYTIRALAPDRFQVLD